jgi:hypothetical protein
MISHGISKFLGGAWLCVLALAGLFAACDGKSATTSDSETHFLEKCSDSCSGGLTCLCGVCTKACTAQASCGDLATSASCEDSCSDSSTKVCDVACSGDADCSSLGAEFGCNNGHCRQDAQGAGGAGGAGVGPGGVAGAADAIAGTAGTPALSACRSEPDLTPSFPAPTALDPDLVARAAAVIGSCMPDDGVARNATFIWLEHLGAPRLYFRMGEQLDCFANAGCGCDAVEHCLSWVYHLAPAVCPAATCEGDVFSGCGDGSQVSIDCSRFGLSCDPAANCVGEGAVACDGSEAPTCTAQGDALFCDDGALRKTPCQALGFSCVAGQCVGAGAACSGHSDSPELAAPVGTACSGDTLQACLNGHTTSMDCTTQGPGFSCQSVDGSFFCGLSAECVPADTYLSAQPATCNGSVLSFCNAGRLEHLDCTTLGFTGCEIDTKLDHYGCTPGVQLK